LTNDKTNYKKTPSNGRPSPEMLERKALQLDGVTVAGVFG